jgi:hypothetical protein
MISLLIAALLPSPTPPTDFVKKYSAGESSPYDEVSVDLNQQQIPSSIREIGSFPFENATTVSTSTKQTTTEGPNPTVTTDVTQTTTNIPVNTPEVTP